jgi:RIO-like serine/threonine protein kinase
MLLLLERAMQCPLSRTLAYSATLQMQKIKAAEIMAVVVLAVTHIIALSVRHIDLSEINIFSSS